MLSSSCHNLFLTARHLGGEIPKMSNQLTNGENLVKEDAIAPSNKKKKVGYQVSSAEMGR